VGPLVSTSKSHGYWRGVQRLVPSLSPSPTANFALPHRRASAAAAAGDEECMQLIAAASGAASLARLQSSISCDHAGLISQTLCLNESFGSGNERDYVVHHDWSNDVALGSTATLVLTVLGLLDEW
jgi:hypothetical protein